MAGDRVGRLAAPADVHKRPAEVAQLFSHASERALSLVDGSEEQLTKGGDVRPKQWFAVLTTAFATLGMVGLNAVPAHASSHREAPLISQDPTADNTDLYTFRDPNDPT